LSAGESGCLLPLVRTRNIAGGRFAVSLLAREIGARLEVINLGTAKDPGPFGEVLGLHIRPGTADCRRASVLGRADLVFLFSLFRGASPSGPA